jgi:hypothetical protein
MKISLKLLCTCLLLVPGFLYLGGCGCGFDCNSDDEGNDNGNPALLTLGLSDSVPEDLKQVEIKVASITFSRSGAEPVVVENFTTPGGDTSTFQVDLLDYPGTDQLVVIKDLELDAGTYSGISIAIIDDDINSSFVQESDDTRKEITVANGVLNLPGITLAPGAQAFTVEFGLAQALQYQAASGKYLLATTGIRIENNATAATLSGGVDSTLFNGVSPCNGKTEPTSGNRVYLYQGSGLANDRLVDVYTSGSTTFPPSTAVKPFAVATLIENTNTDNWEYTFGYLPAGDYTMAFACDTQSDDAVQYNGLQIPLPTTQKYNVSLSESDKVVCNLPAADDC